VNATCIKSLSLKNFRCFTNTSFSFDAPVVLIEGLNGSGKTSLLEAIHYLCYVRSFRTHIPQDLVSFGSETFFIAATLQNDQVTIGSTGTKRQVKINQKPITSYTQLRSVCRVVTVTQEDIDIVKSSPEKRRSFLDHALVLHNPELAENMKMFRHILDTRNAFLVRGGTEDEFDIWTEKLWLISRSIQKERGAFLTTILEHAKKLEHYFLPSHTCSIVYQAKQDQKWETYEQFYAQSQKLFERERYLRRSLFGAHLDDIEILFNGKPARLFSSRGQQKLLTLFLKIAQVATLKSIHGPTIFLIDDFLSDFDNATLLRIIKTCLLLEVQLIFTTPLSSGPEHTALKEIGCDFLKISI
jgi:DNA replication and repair protein RecF